MKRRVVFGIALALMLCMCACGHKHTWKSATCTEAKTCTECGETDGAPLGHKWKDATCTEPKTCTVCGATEGAALGHTWKEATCTEPKTCTVCGTMEGSPLGHVVDEWEITKESTCSETGLKKGTCTVCGEHVEAEITMKEHTPSDWIITNPATKQAKGTRVQKCTVCGKELKTEYYTASPEELEQQYKVQCQTFLYDDLQRRPGEFKNKYIKLSGTVFQIVSESTSKDKYSAYFINASGNLYLVFIDNYGSGTRILEKDSLTVWGKVGDLYTYETIRGNSNTIPTIYAEYYQ